MILNHAREFKYMDEVFAKWNKKYYAISSGDAEALVLGYVSFREIEKKEISYKPYKYLALWLSCWYMQRVQYTRVYSMGVRT